MNLSRSDQKELLNAILSAYPSKEALGRFAYFELEESLDEIAGGNTITDVIFNLITQWAIPKGKIDELIEKAYKENPENPDLKDFYYKIIKQNPTIYKELGVEKSSFERSQVIENSEWNQLYEILKEINNNQLITQVCKKTLKNHYNDLLGNFPQLSKTIDLRELNQFLLVQFPKRKDNVPTIIEFAERLSDKVVQPFSNELKQWLQAITARLKISLPTYSPPAQLLSNNNIYEYFLLITVQPSLTQKNKFELYSDLLLYNFSEDKYQTNDKFQDCQDKNLNNLEFAEIQNKIVEVIEISINYLNIPYNLNLELFLTYKYLGYPFDIEPIVTKETKKSNSYLGREYPLFVRSYERFNNKKVFNKFYKRWCTKVQDKCVPSLAKFFESLQEVTTYEQNGDELTNQWEVDEIVGLKIMGCWSNEESVQEELFNCIVKSGIPFALWIRCNDLADCQKELNKLLTLKNVNNWRDLFKQVLKCRQQAYKKPEKLGYHLGILADDPQRIPSNCKFKLIPTGQ